jgi:hypothetical protein
MAIKLNLLPAEYVVSGSLGKILKTTRSLGVILIAAFIIFVVVLGAFFLISNFQLTDASGKEADLKSQIAAEEESEQKTVLLKDRLKKIKTVQTVPNSQKNVGNLDPVILGLGSNATLTELSADSEKADLSINFKNNSDMAGFLENIDSIKTFKTVIMTTFGFNPTSGYLVSIRLF